MKFSIRELLGVTFLAVLAMLAWRSSSDLQRDRERMASLEAEVRSLRARMSVSKSGLHQAYLRTLDEYKSLGQVRERAVEHFAHLEEKYGVIREPEPGVLAIRALPVLNTNRGARPIRYRLWVPRNRSVWLKFGVHLDSANLQASNIAEESELLRESPLQHSGPFEIRLPAGEQTLEITRGAAQDGTMPLTLGLSGTTLLQSAFISPDLAGAGGSYLTAKSQVEFGTDETHQWLLSLDLNYVHDSPGDASETTHGFTVWLSDHASGFESFPGDAP